MPTRTTHQHITRLFAVLVMMLLASLFVQPVAAMPEETVRGYIWIDANCDGIRQDTEAPLTTAVVHLFSAGADGVVPTPDDQVIAVSGVATTGEYVFDLGTTGIDYRVTFIEKHIPFGYRPAPYQQGSDRSRDNDLTIINTTWSTAGFRMDEHATVRGIDLGLCRVEAIQRVSLPLVVR